MLSNFLNDRGEEKSNVQLVWPPTFAGYVWDHEIDDGMNCPLQLELGCLSKLKNALQNVVWWNGKSCLSCFEGRRLRQPALSAFAHEVKQSTRRSGPPWSS